MNLLAHKTTQPNHPISWCFSSSFSNGKEKDYESGFHYYGARYYWSEILTSWLSVDPMMDKYPSLSPYAYCAWNPVKLVDPDGRIPIPLKSKYNDWAIKIDSWFGKRNTGLVGASTFHRGLDFNYDVGGDSDYGSPILATHEGVATVDDNPDGGEGRSVVITSPDGLFRTRYFHLSKININEGDYVSEADVIAEMGGSAYGKEHGRTSHLHYEIQEKHGEKWVSINPSKTGKRNIEDLYDPQTWILPEDRKDNRSQLLQLNPGRVSISESDNTRVDMKTVELSN